MQKPEHLRRYEAWTIYMDAHHWYSYNPLQIYDRYSYPEELDMGLYIDKKNDKSSKEPHPYVLFR